MVANLIIYIVLTVVLLAGLVLAIVWRGWRRLLGIILIALSIVVAFAASRHIYDSHSQQCREAGGTYQRLPDTRVRDCLDSHGNVIQGWEH